METKSLDIGDALSSGWNAVKANPVPAIAGILICAVLYFVPGLIPYAGYVWRVFIGAAIVGGLAILSLNLVNRNNPQIGDVFGGLKKYVPFLIAYLILGVATSLPAFLLGLVGGFVAVLGGFISLALGIVALLYGGMTYFVIAENGPEVPVTKALARSVELTDGQRFMLVLVVIVLGLISLLIVTIPIVACAWAAIYNQLKALKPDQTATDAAPPTV